MVEQLNMDTNKEEILLKWNDIEWNINDFEFNNTTDVLDSINNFAKFTFDQIIGGKIILQNLEKQEQKRTMDSMIHYIKNSSNKDYILDKYFESQENLPWWLAWIIENTYYDDIWEIELNKFFDGNDLISLWRSIVWENWDWSNISLESPGISDNCPWSFFSEWQFVSEFNRRNSERINNNLNNLDGLNIMELFGDVWKMWWKLYLNNEEITDKSFEDPKIYNRIYQKLWAGNFANVNEFQKLISTEINKWINLLLENTEDENDKKENKESSNLINSIESMELENIWELTDGDAVQIENVNHIFDISKKFFIKRIQSGESQITNPNTIKKQIAYILGTAKWECRFKNLKQKWSKNKYCGRWFVQLTYGYNYKKFGDIARDSGFTFKDNNWNILSEDDLDLYNHPDNLLKSNELAAFILVHWSINWLFTWKKLDDYINDNSTNFLWARKIIWWKYPSKYVNTANICLSHINIW